MKSIIFILLLAVGFRCSAQDVLRMPPVAPAPSLSTDLIKKLTVSEETAYLLKRLSDWTHYAMQFNSEKEAISKLNLAIELIELRKAIHQTKQVSAAALIDEKLMNIFVSIQVESADYILAEPNLKALINIEAYLNEDVSIPKELSKISADFFEKLNRLKESS
ncbi:hypothetical protein [Agaribacter flavus]|uniref:DUF5667 domain-containing protein n=1 Tax=Agaribacter flavus TaxID=1902781 RepID=A0ABV7FVC7_9ALTE